MGGVFERLIKSTKRCLRKIIGQAKLTYDELLTAIVEVEMVINSRPLSYDDFEEPLTPSHLMVGRRLMSVPDAVYKDNLDEDGVNSAVFSRRAQHLSRTLDQFWRTKYLLELREAHHYSRSCTDNRRISVGDIVVVQTEGQPRGFWKLAKVERMITGPDGVTRGAVIRVAGKGKQLKTLSRPVQHLFLLEINCQIAEVQSQAPLVDCPRDPACSLDNQIFVDHVMQDEAIVHLDEVGGPLRRSRRGAARMARDLWPRPCTRQTKPFLNPGSHLLTRPLNSHCFTVRLTVFWSNLMVSLSYSQISLFLHISHCGMLKISLFCTFTL